MVTIPALLLWFIENCTEISAIFHFTLLSCVVHDVLFTLNKQQQLVLMMIKMIVKMKAASGSVRLSLSLKVAALSVGVKSSLGQWCFFLLSRPALYTGRTLFLQTHTKLIQNERLVLFTSLSSKLDALQTTGNTCFVVNQLICSVSRLFGIITFDQKNYFSI